VAAGNIELKSGTNTGKTSSARMGKKEKREEEKTGMKTKSAKK